MIELLFILYICLLLHDWVNLDFFRQLIYSFLLSKRNVRSAKKLHKQQSRKDRFTLAYIKNYTPYQKQFSFWQKMRCLYYIITAVQDLSLILVNLFSIIYTINLLIIFIVIKAIVLVILRSQFKSSRIAKFDKRY